MEEELLDIHGMIFASSNHFFSSRCPYRHLYSLQVKCKDGKEDFVRWQQRKIPATGFCAGTVPAAKAKRAKKIPRGWLTGDFIQLENIEMML
jgi:hypothetical protein